MFTRHANRRERSNIREPVAESLLGRELNQSKEIKSKLKSVAGCRYRFRAGEKEMGRGRGWKASRELFADPTLEFHKSRDCVRVQRAVVERRSVIV